MGWYYAPLDPDVTPGQFNRDNNATWLRQDWLWHTNDEFQQRDLFARLSAQGVRTIFVEVGALQRDGALPPFNLAAVRRLANAAFLGGSGVQVYAWLTDRTANGQRLDPWDPVVRDNVAAAALRLTDAGFHGVLLTPERVPDGDLGWLRLLQEVRLLLPASARVASSGNMIFGVVDPILWSPSYYGEVARQVNDLVAMGYDSLAHPNMLHRHIKPSRAREVLEAARTANPDVQVWFSLPTYEEPYLIMNPWSASLEDALDRLNLTMALIPQEIRETAQGVALLTEWTTSEQEWGHYRRIWLGR